MKTLKSKSTLSATHEKTPCVSYRSIHSEMPISSSLEVKPFVSVPMGMHFSTTEYDRQGALDACSGQRIPW